MFRSYTGVGVFASVGGQRSARHEREFSASKVSGDDRGTFFARLRIIHFGLAAAIGRIVLLPLALILFTLSACAQPVALKGTDLGKEPAPDFTLTDQNGRLVSLSGLRGRVVVLTFLYTHCPDVCPLIADHLRITSEQLGSASDKVAYVAVSVDPEHDTPAAIRTFDGQHHLNGMLIYLNGSREQLQQVWANYYVASQVIADGPEGIAHSSRVVVIDKAGNQRANLGSDFDPGDLAFNIRVLLNE